MKIKVYGIRNEKGRVLFTASKDKNFLIWLRSFLEETIHYSSLIAPCEELETKRTPKDEHATYGTGETKIDVFYGDKKAFVLVSSPNKKKIMNLITKSSTMIPIPKNGEND